jgi:hypothetical protein
MKKTIQRIHIPNSSIPLNIYSMKVCNHRYTTKQGAEEEVVKVEEE